MAYTALYRKWRPPVFEDVKGQDHIVTALKNQIKSDRIGHAYLFCGTRGTGKTTVAKIFAKAVNCESPVDGDPCGKCAVCRAIDSGSSMNVVEIDAASNNGVDNIREIKDAVQYSPSEGKYRVYIIDEVHMLSTGAFNALLKTLEEPPSYVIFILATTEAHKIPVTVLSRCQRYDFRRIGSDTIAARLKEMTDAEKIEADDDAIRYVAKKGDGSLRDAISLLDQCIAFYYGERLTFDKVLQALGAVDNEVFSEFFRSIVENDTIGCIKRIDELLLDGREPVQFVNDFIWYLRNMLLIKTSKASDEVIDMCGADKERLKQDAELISADSVIRYIRVLSELSSQMRYSTGKRVLLEIAVIKLSKPEMEVKLDSILERLEKVENQLESGVIQVKQESVPETGRAAQPEEKKTSVKLPPARYEDLQAVRENWGRIIAEADVNTKYALRESFVEPLGDGEMVIVFKDPMYANIIGREEILQSISDAAEKLINKKISFKIKSIEEGYHQSEYISDDELKDVFKDNIFFSDNPEDETFSDDTAETENTDEVLQVNSDMYDEETQGSTAEQIQYNNTLSDNNEEDEEDDDREEFLEEDEMSQE